MTLEKTRIIVHIDLDAFYCQVEHLRLQIPINEPLAVQQWHGLIAVNYAARSKGIKRHCTVKEALELCPELHLIHVATTTNEDATPTYREYKDISYQTHKISLDFYRKASMAIMKLFSSFCIQFQRASIDEAYLDLSEQINQECYQELELKSLKKEEDEPIVDWTDTETCVIGLPIIETETYIKDKEENQPYLTTKGWTDYKLKIAAKTTLKIRNTLYNQLGYTCSAGISINKTLAKLISSHHKPNKQTVLPILQIQNYLKDLPYKSLRGLGGKLGDSIESLFRIKSISELVAIPLKDLHDGFGTETGSWLYDLSRGICIYLCMMVFRTVKMYVGHEPVNQVNLVKSFAACKSFRPYLNNLEQLLPWIDILAFELYSRIFEEYDMNKRWGKTLTLNVNIFGQVKSKSTPLIARLALDSPTLIAKQTLDLFESSTKNTSLENLSRISLTVTALEKEPENQKLVSNWLSKKSCSSMERYNCPDCGKFILLLDKQEHQDFHFAMQISKNTSSRPMKQLRLTGFFSK